MSNRNKNVEPTTYERIMRAEKMTPERLRAYPGFERIGEEEAHEVIETLETFCNIVVHHISNK